MFFEIAFGVCFGILLAMFIAYEFKNGFRKSLKFLKWGFIISVIIIIIIFIVASTIDFHDKNPQLFTKIVVPIIAIPISFYLLPLFNKKIYFKDIVASIKRKLFSK